MNLRVTSQTIVDNAIHYTGQATTALAQLQQEASSGNRILQPSDDPISAVAVINDQAQNTRYTTDLTNINTATSTLNVSVSTLQSVNSLLINARQLAIQGTNSGLDQSALSALGTQVNALLSQLVGLSNTQSGGQYIFSGTKTNQVPFATDSAGNVTYQGGTQPSTTPVSGSQTVNLYAVGSQVFQGGTQRATSVYTGTTGAAPGTGTDSATGQGTLVVAHTSTTYGGTSGVAVGTSSATGDTILGPSGANNLTIADNGSGGGTVSLNGGTPVSYTSTDQNLKVTGPSGEIVYLNTTGIASNFNGSVPITANGTISTGGTAVPINFSSNQAVTDAHGGATNVDTTKVTQAGTESVSYTGTYDAFQALTALRDDLNNTHGLSASAQTTAISSHLGEIDQANQQVLNVIGQQSATLQNLTSLQGQVQSAQLQTQQLVSNLQGADIATVSIQLQAQQNQLQLTLAATARMFQQSLLDFIK